MWTIQIVVRVEPNKRDEFLHCARGLLADEVLRSHRSRLLCNMDDPNLYCWLADAPTRRELTALVESPTFHALRGAAEVLGGVEEIRVLRDQP